MAQGDVRSCIRALKDKTRNFETSSNRKSLDAEIDDVYHTSSKHPSKSSLMGEGVWVSATNFDKLKEANDGECNDENSHEFWVDSHIFEI